MELPPEVSLRELLTTFPGCFILLLSDFFSPSDHFERETDSPFFRLLIDFSH